MPLKSNALISLPELKVVLEIKDDEGKSDELLERYINVASQEIETYTRRKWITPGTAFEDIFDGNGKQKIATRYYPVVADIDFIYFWDGTAWTALSSPTYTVNEEDGIVYFQDGNFFTVGNLNWKLEYTYGYAIANVPMSIKEACIKLVNLHKIENDQKLTGATSYSYGNEATTYDFEKAREYVYGLLKPFKSYRRYSRG